jgi:hypothetical protein
VRLLTPTGFVGTAVGSHECAATAIYDWDAARWNGFVVVGPTDQDLRYTMAMSTKRDRWSCAATVTVSVGPLRCFATMKSASPARGDSLS